MHMAIIQQWTPRLSQCHTFCILLSHSSTVNHPTTGDENPSDITIWKFNTVSYMCIQNTPMTCDQVLTQICNVLMVGTSVHISRKYRFVTLRLPKHMSFHTRNMSHNVFTQKAIAITNTMGSRTNRLSWTRVKQKYTRRHEVIVTMAASRYLCVD
jgi:hypothetical protein